MKPALAPQQAPLARTRPAIPRPAPRSIPAPKPNRLDFAAPPAAREPFDSSVRFVEDAPVPANRGAALVLDALNEKLLNFTMDLVCLETAIADAGHPAPQKQWLSRRGVALSLTRDAVQAMLVVADDPAVANLFSEDGALAPYLQGLFLYCDAVTGAIVRFASGDSAGETAWTSLRDRIKQATHWYFDGLPREVRSDALSAGLAPGALDTLDDLFFAACFLAEGLDERVG
jgi:hypothetical protein